MGGTEMPYTDPLMGGMKGLFELFKLLSLGYSHGGEGYNVNDEEETEEEKKKRLAREFKSGASVDDFPLLSSHELSLGPVQTASYTLTDGASPAPHAPTKPSDEGMAPLRYLGRVSGGSGMTSGGLWESIPERPAGARGTYNEPGREGTPGSFTGDYAALAEALGLPPSLRRPLNPLVEENYLGKIGGIAEAVASIEKQKAEADYWGGRNPATVTAAGLKGTRGSSTAASTPALDEVRRAGGDAVLVELGMGNVDPSTLPVEILNAIASLVALKRSDPATYMLQLEELKRQLGGAGGGPRSGGYLGSQGSPDARRALQLISAP